MKYDLFVSYSKAHEDLVGPLVKMLKLNNRKVFLDSEAIQPGQKWEDILNNSVPNCRQVLLIWCCHAAESDWVRKEIELALACEKPIVPVLLCRPVTPEKVSQFQWIDFRPVIPHRCIDQEHDPEVAPASKPLARKQWSSHTGELLPASVLATIWPALALSILVLLLLTKPLPPFLGEQIASDTNLVLLFLCIIAAVYLVKRIRDIVVFFGQYRRGALRKSLPEELNRTMSKRMERGLLKLDERTREFVVRVYSEIESHSSE